MYVTQFDTYFACISNIRNRAVLHNKGQHNNYNVSLHFIRTYYHFEFLTSIRHRSKMRTGNTVCTF